MKSIIFQKKLTKGILILLVIAQLLIFAGCQKKYTTEDLYSYYEEILHGQNSEEYFGIVEISIDYNDRSIAVFIDEGHEKAQQTADVLKEKYGDVVRVNIGDYHTTVT